MNCFGVSKSEKPEKKRNRRPLRKSHILNGCDPPVDTYKPIYRKWISPDDYLYRLLFNQ